MTNRARTSDKPQSKVLSTHFGKQTGDRPEHTWRAAHARDDASTPDFETEVDHDREWEQRGKSSSIDTPECSKRPWN